MPFLNQLFMEPAAAIRIRCILEILGAPKEYISQKLREHVDKLKENGLVVELEKYAEAVSKEKLFMQFVELEISFTSAKELLDFCFDNMPSSIEILSPESLSLDMSSFEDILNDFSAKLHHADALIKSVSSQKQLLDRNTVNIFHNFIKYACSVSPRSIAELEELLGLGGIELKPFVEHLAGKGILEKEGDKYITK